MNQTVGAILLVLSLSGVGEAATACDDQRSVEAAGSLLHQALSELRDERDRQMQAQARIALAQLRSETETALAQGASTAAGHSVRTGP